jgi:hypothetical protein
MHYSAVVILKINTKTMLYMPIYFPEIAFYPVIHVDYYHSGCYVSNKKRLVDKFMANIIRIKG